MYPNGKHPQETPEAMPENVEEVGAYLRQWRDPAPDPAAKAHLLETLLAEMPQRQTLPPERAPMRRKQPLGMAWAWLILKSQTRLVHPATWAASGLVIALGALVSLAFYQPSQAGAELPFVFIAPLVAACGVAFLYGLEADPALELQLSTPVSPRVILLARLALLFGFNLVITLVCSVLLSLFQAQITLAPLIVAWLAPMTFLSALAFLLSVLFFDSLAAVLISFLLWVGTALRHFIVSSEFIFPDLLNPAFYPPMLILAPALVLLALWVAEREERWSGGIR
jgi:hypothetical protein